MEKRPLIAIPIGDPAGIGPEITVKTMISEEAVNAARMVVVGDERIMRRALTFPNMPEVEIKVISSVDEGDYRVGVLNLIDLHNLSPEDYEMGQISAKCGRACYEYIEKTVQMAMEREVDAVTTTCINKESVRAAEVPYIGHTEMFGGLTGTENPLTIFEVNDSLTFFLSRHVSLMDACRAVTKENIVNYVRRMDKILKQLGVTEGTIAVAGLNPHCGEHGLFGSEEVNEIMPAVEQLQKEGYNVAGPISADSVFYQTMQGKYNSVLSLYHDQGHIATKTYDFHRTISITGGMPILRTSVDHGTAFDIAGTGIASSVSLVEAVRVGAKYAPKFSGERA